MTHQPPESERSADRARSSSDDARDLFAEYTYLKERGGAPSFEHWVRAHERHERELRAQHERWLALEPLVEELAFDDAEDLLADAHELGPLFEDIRRRKDAADRYEVLEKVGHGGMGVVFKVRDRHLERVVGMKVLRRQWNDRGRTSDAGFRSLQRFLEEARIASRLNHPGIVPVHELGCDERGHVFFTMGFIEGRDLGHLLRERAAGRAELSLARAVDLILRACEAIAHAHDHGVLHRDVKPSNVMVGTLGQVYVTDWGLARLREGGVEPDTGADEEPSDVLRTRAGQALGTVPYMSPEQARGEHDRVGPWSDVYSLGAVLYEVLCDRRPYARESESFGTSDLLRHVRSHPPEAIEKLAPLAPAELCAICRKAMEREPHDRYPGARELAADLRAHIEGRVVAAHRTDRLEKLVKWIRRNRSLAGALAAALVLALGASAAIVWLSADARRAADEVFRLAARQDLDGLIRRADELWPPHPDRIEAFERWLEEADALVKSVGRHRATLAELRSRARVVPLERWIAEHPDHPKLVELESARADLAQVEALAPAASERSSARLRQRVAALEREVDALDRLEFEKDADRWWHDQLSRLVTDIEAFAEPERGSIDGLSRERGWGVRRRLEFARGIAARDDASAWSEVALAVKADERYGGLELRPQAGLVPLGRDPRSGLFEFAHPQSGEPPRRDPATGELVRDARSSIVLVLIPAGRANMGAQIDPALPHFDADATLMERPRQEIELDAFLLSKFELTQAQWRRATGDNPSYYGGDTSVTGIEGADLHPVENVNWEQCQRVLSRFGLVLPTEARWEYACRAGTETIWYTGDDVASLVGFENLLGKEGLGFYDRRIEHETGFDDGFIQHAAVGSLAPNPFGLHDMIGNVSEWCRDRIGSLGTHVRRGDGERLESTGHSRTARGSSFYGLAHAGRPSTRRYRPATEQLLSLGCRPARTLER